MESNIRAEDIADTAKQVLDEVLYMSEPSDDSLIGSSGGTNRSCSGDAMEGGHAMSKHHDRTVESINVPKNMQAQRLPYHILTLLMSLE